MEITGQITPYIRHAPQPSASSAYVDPGCIACASGRERLASVLQRSTASRAPLVKQRNLGNKRRSPPYNPRCCCCCCCGARENGIKCIGALSRTFLRPGAAPRVIYRWFTRPLHVCARGRVGRWMGWCEGETASCSMRPAGGKWMALSAAQLRCVLRFASPRVPVEYRFSRA